MTQELFEKAKFGDRFVTRGGQEALFLRLTENSEWRFADFYVKNWGQIRVNRENGKCLNGPDIENDIVGMMPSLPSELDEASEKNFETMEVLEHENIFEETHNRIFKAGAEWMAGQGVSFIGECNDEEFIDTEHGIFSFEKRPFVDGDKVVVQIRKK